MTDEERIELGESRKRIFRNFCNGVPFEQLDEPPFNRSAQELEREILFVARKINEYRLKRCKDASKHAAPPVRGDSLFDIRWNRLAMLETLGKLGPLYLSSELLLPTVKFQRVDRNETVLKEIEHRLANA